MSEDGNLYKYAAASPPWVRTLNLSINQDTSFLSGKNKVCSRFSIQPNPLIMKVLTDSFRTEQKSEEPSKKKPNNPKSENKKKGSAGSAAGSEYVRAA